MLSGRRLAVWGDPIAHSRSPQMHAAAYGVLGLDWSYGRRRVDDVAFTTSVAGLGAEWRGLSLTMPLKSVAFAAAARVDRGAELTRAVNTYVFDADGPVGFNTDIGGIVAALAEIGHAQVAAARIVGAGATATSALVALQLAGAERVDVVARRPEAAQDLVELGSRIGVRVTVGSLAGRHDAVPLTVATLPGDAAVPSEFAHGLAAAGGTLFDAVYGHWPTCLAAAWHAQGADAHSGLGMLLHQAVRQVRIFRGGDPDAALPREADVVAAMRLAVVGD
ncbi:shikimate dehydrogenase [Microbacterium sp. SSW1-59]|uniref:shikimate dehydrogenase n=1 Tax=Microbacterium xanthum TaxID=3079794 RepID=UPI002AD53FC3|nr:shikimate dehydrogenase [Microbacterium sp. SSW1-59]MDZ8202413.1 shikimate dehydrogenase [Microbacterium sp. SSW1-59]